MKLEFCCPTLFGLEGIVADELRFGGKLTDVRAENGRVLFTGDEDTLIWANMNLRCAERVLIRLAAFRADTFDQLFEGVKAIPWEDFLPVDAAFPVKGHALDSKLHSVPDCQKIIKKAIVTRLGGHYGVSWFEEKGVRCQVQFSIMHDMAEIHLDTSGSGLHKRGYRANANAAPLRETLAAAMVKLARWRGRDALIDPFCGSGTIAIEAAMIALNRAPGLIRTYDAEKWSWVGDARWKAAREQAIAAVRTDLTLDMCGSDIDPACVVLAQENAKKAGVGHLIRFEQADAAKRVYPQSGVLFANPPYGERLMDRESAQAIYRAVGRAVGKSELRQYYLTSDPEFECFYGYQADKRRKLYNGMIKCDLYMYFRPQEARRPFGRRDSKVPNSGKRERR
ncbi:THUMP domain-containing class I SAM-dependent RNA methyltransferase [Butyricicoccus pullicaecorum]|uniref:THUMP domain-containing class I SAM-dependent RNA methyltransferase n=1 Tax=Butyricicoccus pullicaecorum TaxID=501571 RepID=UPI00399056F2